MVKMKRKRKALQAEETLNESFETITVSTSESESTAKSDVDDVVPLTPTAAAAATTEFPDKDDVVIVDSKVILVLDSARPFYFKGSLRVRVLSGVVDVLGASLSPTGGERDVFSPRGYSLLCFSVSPNVKSPSDAAGSTEALRQSLMEAGVKSIDIRTRLMASAEKGLAVVLLSKLEVDANGFVSKHLIHSVGGNFQLFGRDAASASSVSLCEAERVLDVSFFVQNSGQDVKARLYRPNIEWENAVRSINFTIQDEGQPRLLVAGGKGVGKSTFLRFLVNRVLAEVGSPVVVVDLDPGQAEFTVPGCVSCTKVSEPLLGPNFTHLSVKKEVTYFFGSVDVASSQPRFVKCLDELRKSCSDLTSLPWIINTMGFTEGLGIFLMKKAVEMFRPTTIVQIESRSAKKNFKPRDFFQNLISSLKLSCNVLKFSAIPESVSARDFGNQDSWGIPQASKLRDIVMLSYLHNSFPACTSLQAVVPRCVGWAQVYIQILNVRESFSVKSLLQILNTSFVSLGRLPAGVASGLKSESLNVLRSPDVLVPSLGFGIVRAIDVERRLFYVVTDLDEAVLADVNCLTMGPTVRLPDGILINQSSISKSKTPPYVKQSRSKNLLSTPWQRHSKPKPDN